MRLLTRALGKDGNVMLEIVDIIGGKLMYTAYYTLEELFQLPLVQMPSSFESIKIQNRLKGNNFYIDEYRINLQSNQTIYMDRSYTLEQLQQILRKQSIFYDTHEELVVYVSDDAITIKTFEEAIGSAVGAYRLTQGSREALLQRDFANVGITDGRQTYDFYGLSSMAAWRIEYALYEINYSCSYQEAADTIIRVFYYLALVPDVTGDIEDIIDKVWNSDFGKTWYTKNNKKYRRDLEINPFAEHIERRDKPLDSTKASCPGSDTTYAATIHDQHKVLWVKSFQNYTLQEVQKECFADFRDLYNERSLPLDEEKREWREKHVKNPETGEKMTCYYLNIRHEEKEYVTIVISECNS